MNDDIELRYKAMCERYGEGVRFQRLRRITGYLVGDVSRWNNGKKAELHDREHHTIQNKEL